MQINIDRVLAPMHNLVFTEDKAKGQTVQMDKRTFRKYIMLERRYQKMQEHMKEILKSHRV